MQLGERILIIGPPGAGKSTLAIKLAEKTKLPLVHLDRLFWNPGWVDSDRSEFDLRLKRVLE
jgi:adenylate kinase family enzyme